MNPLSGITPRAPGQSSPSAHVPPHIAAPPAAVALTAGNAHETRSPEDSQAIASLTVAEHGEGGAAQVHGDDAPLASTGSQQREETAAPQREETAVQEHGEGQAAHEHAAGAGDRGAGPAKTALPGPVEKAVEQHNVRAGSGEDAPRLEMTSGGSLMQMDDEMSLTILHTNDLHGFLSEKEGDGGFAEIAQKIKDINREKDNVVYLDAGDSTEGTHVTNDAKGKPAIDSMNSLNAELRKQDAAKAAAAGGSGRPGRKVFTTIGNHEAYYGADVLRENVKRFSNPALVSNLRGSGGKPLENTKPYEIFTFKDKEGREVRAAIVGVTTEETGQREGVTVSDPIEAVKENARKAKGEGADIVIVLSHCGTEKDREIAESCDDVNVIVGGHSHDRIEEPIKVNNAVIVQAGSNAESLGELEITVNPKTKEIIPGKTTHRLIEITKEMPGDPGIEKIVRKYEDRRREQEYGREVGTLEEALPSPKETPGETKLGNAFADRVRKEGEADIAIFNKGAFRARLERGKVTKRHCDNVFHYKDKVVQVKMTGAAVQQALEKNFDDVPNGGIFVTSGLKVEYDPLAPRGGKVRSVQVERRDEKGGVRYEPLEPDREYALATGSYLAERNRWGEGGKTRVLRPAKEIFDEMIKDTEKSREVFNVSTDRLRDLSVNDPSLDEKVGRTMFPLIPPSDRPETNLGNFMADTVKESALASVGLLNRGSIRDGIDMGDITKRQMFFAFPYDDELVSGDFTGAQLKTLLEKGFDRRTAGLFAVSGLELRYDPGAPSGEKVKELLVNGKPLDPERTYRVGFTDFMRNQYRGLDSGKNVVEHGRLRDLFALRAKRSLENPSYLQVASNRLKEATTDSSATAVA